ncbi:hypothetical protein ABZ387_32765 [Streptomyces flaveolus]|uniref:hypothetical protein n=1 Tax=Streptomyces flaveolus TaxID=67297 RepID=UPI0033C59C59
MHRTNGARPPHPLGEQRFRQGPPHPVQLVEEWAVGGNEDVEHHQMRGRGPSGLPSADVAAAGPDDLKHHELWRAPQA